MIIETVPNFSEGRNQETLDAIAASFRGAGARLLDYSGDVDHNRSVFTAAGTAEQIENALLAAIGTARDRIDLRTHKGEHPRVGAADVVPLIPIEGVTVEECVALARKIGARIWSELGIPVYLYESAATRPHCKNLADVRKGGFEGLESKMQDPKWAPDFGDCKPHPSAGAVVLGVRKFLIAYNFLLDTDDIAVARKISGIIRERDGGLPCVKALGMMLEGKGAQVSVNLTDYEVTGLYEVYTAVEREAARLGARVVSSELIGLVPERAMADAAAKFLKMENYCFGKVLEERLR
ncbi:MAG: glutamate formimidoyltransferase [Clostridia bacterium]|nr:glutamate formimidoyltransferase [Clostridia bacterium]